MLDTHAALRASWRVVISAVCAVTLLAAVAARAELPQHPTPPAAFMQPGDDTYIAVFAGLHNPPLRQLGQAIDQNSTTEPACGGVAWRGVQQAAAAEWALKAINHQTITNHSIGLQVMDTCGDPTIALQQLLALVSRTAQQDAPALIGVVAVGGTAETSSLHPLLTSLSVPMLVTSVEASYDLTPSPVLFSASPHLETLMKSVVAVVGQMLVSGSGNTRVTVLWSSSKAMRELQTEVGRAGLVIGGEQRLVLRDAGSNDRSSPSLREQIFSFQRSNRLMSEDVVILLLNLQEAWQLQEGARASFSRIPKLRWVLASAEDDPWAHEQDIIELSRHLRGLVVVGSHSPHLSALQEHLADEVCDDANNLHEDSDPNGENVLVKRMDGKLNSVDNVVTQTRTLPPNEVWSSSRIKFADFSSSPLDSPKSSILWPVLREYCQIISEQQQDSGSGLSRFIAVDATRSAAALRAVSTLAAAFRMVQLDRCPDQVNCTEVFDSTVHQEVVHKLDTLSYDVQEGADRLRFTVDARLSTAYSVVTVVSGTVVQIGHYLERSGMQWTEVPEALSSSQPKQEEQHAAYRPRLSKPLVARRPLRAVHHFQNGDHWRTTAWSVIICVVAAVGIVSCFLVATYLAIRTCDGTLSNTEVPGVLILVGTSLVFVGSVITVLPAPEYDLAVMCCLQHVLPYVATALTYAALLTKALHVLVLNAMRLHSKIPPAVLYLPLTALVALAMLVAALGDATTLHFILPNEVSSLTTYDTSGGNNHSRSVSLIDGSSFTSERQFTKVVREEDAYEFTQIQVCKRPDQIPAVMGFAYLIVMLIVTLIILCSTKSTNNDMKGFHECRRMMALCCVSVPLVLLWGAVSLYAPLHVQQPLTALSLLLVGYFVLALILIPHLYRISSRKVNQFSHKPLSGETSPISTVFKSHATMTPNFTHPVVAYTSRGDEDGCRFSDIYLGRNFGEKTHGDNLGNWKTIRSPRPNKYATSWNPMNGMKIPRHEGYPKIPQRCSHPTTESPTRNKQHMETFR